MYQRCADADILASETIRAGKLKFYTHLHGSSALFGNGNFSARGVSGCSAPSLKLGPLKFISLEASKGRSTP